MDPFSTLPTYEGLLLWPTLSFLAGLGLRALAWHREREGHRTKLLKQLAFLPLILGVGLSLYTLWVMYNPGTGFVYMQQFAYRDRLRQAHYLAIALPLLGFASLVLWEVAEKRRGGPLFT